MMVDVTQEYAEGRGRLKDPQAIEDLTIGYVGGRMTVNGEAVAPGEGVEALILEALGGQAIEGGDPYIARALYRQIEAGEAAPAELVALEAGVDLEGVTLGDLIVHQQDGDLVLAVRGARPRDAANDSWINDEAA